MNSLSSSSENSGASAGLRVSKGSAPAGHWCATCKRGPLFTWERAGNRCIGCADAEVITPPPDEIASAIRAWICATRTELATGYIIDVRPFVNAAPQIVAYKPNVEMWDVPGARPRRNPELSHTMKRKKRNAAARSTLATCSAWAALWTSKNRLDGTSRHIIHENGVPRLFTKRRFARKFIRVQSGYISTRDDVRAEPHGWRVPVAVRVTISLSPNNCGDLHGAAPR